jgi:HK97 family phage portal protein
MCPTILYRRRPKDQGRDRARDHSLYRILHDAPNRDMDTYVFGVQQAASRINTGNSYAQIERAKNGRVLALWPLHPQDVRVFRRRDGQIEYEIRDERGVPSRTVPRRDAKGRYNMLHIAGALSDNCVTGKGIIQQARESIASAQTGQQYQAGLRGSGRPSGLLTRPAELDPLDEKGERALLDTWNREFGSSSNGGMTAHLQDGYTFTPIYLSPADMQYLESQKFDVAEIARWYGLPLHLLGDLSGANYSNMSAQDQAFVKRSIQPWATAGEKAETHQLLLPTEKQGYYIEKELDALLRGDPEARAKVNRLDVMHGKRNPNEVRALDNLDPIEGGDTYFVPSNIVPIEKAIADDPEPIPPESAPDMPTPKSEEQDQGQQGASAQPGESLAEEVADLKAAMAEMPAAMDEMSTAIEEATSMVGRQLARTIDAACEVIYDAAGRMLTKEAKAAKRAAGKPKEFLAWLDSFYDGHEATFTAAIEPGMAAWLAAYGGVDGTATASCRTDDACRKAYCAAVVRMHIETSRNLLLEAAECQPDELVDRVTQLVDSWPTDRRRIELPEIGTHPDG